MFHLLLIFSLGHSQIEASVGLANSVCSEIFNQGVRELDLELIDQTRDESAEALRDVFKNVPAFRNFSKDEISELVMVFRSNELKTKATDVLLADITDNIAVTRNYLQGRIRDRKKQQEDKPTHEFEQALFKASEPATVIAKTEIVENYVTIGDFAEAFRGPSLHRYMLLKPWELHQMADLLQALKGKNISVVDVKEGEGILALVHPKDLAVLPRLVDTLKTVEPFKKDPSSF